MENRNSNTSFLFILIISALVFIFLKVNYNKQKKDAELLYHKGIKTKAYINNISQVTKSRIIYYDYVFKYRDSMYYAHFSYIGNNLKISEGDSIDIYFLESNPRISQSAIDIYEKLNISEK